MPTIAPGESVLDVRLLPLVPPVVDNEYDPVGVAEVAEVIGGATVLGGVEVVATSPVDMEERGNGNGVVEGSGMDGRGNGVGGGGMDGRGNGYCEVDGGDGCGDGVGQGNGDGDAEGVDVASATSMARSTCVVSPPKSPFRLMSSDIVSPA